MDRTRDLVEKILKNENLLTAIKNNSIEDIIGILIDELEGNYQLRDFIYRDVEREYHKIDVENEIEFKNQMYRDECADKNILPKYDDMVLITDEQLEKIIDRYEEYLQDDDTWNYKLRNAIKDVLGDKGEINNE